MTSLADQERGDFSAIQNRATANCQTNARANEESAKDGRQKSVGRDIGKFHEGQAK